MGVCGVGDGVRVCGVGGGETVRVCGVELEEMSVSV